MVAGYANQREVELLVEAGFSSEQAIRIATLNGAKFLGIDDLVGPIAVGKVADLILVDGDPTSHIQDIRQVVMVFKNGVGYDPAKLIEDAKGLVGGVETAAGRQRQVDGYAGGQVRGDRDGFRDA